MQLFNSPISPKVFLTEAEKQHRKKDFFDVIAISALEGYNSDYFNSLQDAYVEGYLTEDDIISLCQAQAKKEAAAYEQQEKIS